MIAVSLFSGIGALDAAVQHVFGCRFVAHVEADAHCRRVLARHWPGVQCHDDVRPLAEPTPIVKGALDIGDSTAI